MYKREVNSLRTVLQINQQAGPIHSRTILTPLKKVNKKKKNIKMSKLSSQPAEGKIC